MNSPAKELRIQCKGCARVMRLSPEQQQYESLACPICKHPLALPKPQQPSLSFANLSSEQLLIAGGILLTAVVLLVILVAVSFVMMTQQDVTAPNVHGAWAYTKQYVRKHLRLQSEVTFPGGPSDLTPDGEGRFLLRSSAIYQVQRTLQLEIHFTGTLVHDGEKWQMESFEQE